ncbi:MAG: phosphatidylglycerol lysyltransferase domain-containing protein, partial [Nitrospirota bacterium]
VRYRLYSSWGLSASEVAKVVMFNGITFWTGFSFVGALIFLLRPMPLSPALHLPIPSDFYVGLICLLAVSSYLAVCLIRKRPVKLFGMEFEIPPIYICFAQIGISSLDWLLAGSVLFMLLRHDLHISYPDFIGIFLFAQIAGLASQAPGGLGVFEMVSLIMLSPYAPPASVLGSLLVFRGIYYILPMIAGILMLGTHEALRNRAFLKSAALSASRAASVLLPDLAGISVFVSGAILLISGAVPTRPDRMTVLAAFLPLPAVEVAHMLAGLTGIVMLFLASGLQRRLKNAYSLSVLALSFGIIFSLTRALDYEEAIFFLVVLAGLLPFKRLFYRIAPLKTQPFSIGWLIAAGLVIISSAAVGLFIYRHVQYTRELWLQFGYFANAARFFRTMVGATAALIFIVAETTLRRPGPKPVLHLMEDIPDAQHIACESNQILSHLAFRKDSKALPGEGHGSFLPVAQGVKMNIALGEPVGPPDARAELAWRFLEYCNRERRPVFYDVSSENRQFYLDLGLSLAKVSEEAKAPLGSNPPGAVFPEDAGYEFRMAGLPATGAAWAEKATKLNGTALTAELDGAGNFPGAVYGLKTGAVGGFLMKSLPVAALFKDGIAAFAYIWQCEARSELFPVVIHVKPGTDALLPLMSGIFRWGREKGFKWLNLGTAPLPAPREHGALNEALAGLPYTHREHFDSLDNLRKFKEKFAPVWEPVYLAIPPGLSPEEAARELTRLFNA